MFCIKNKCGKDFKGGTQSIHNTIIDTEQWQRTKRIQVYRRKEIQVYLGQFHASQFCVED